MPKRSKEDTEITIQTIMDAVVDQILTLGYDKMSYTTLSKQTGSLVLALATTSLKSKILRPHWMAVFSGCSSKNSIWIMV